jgi:hypothetical protein
MGSRRRKLTPEFEHDLNRDPRLGYEAPNTSEFVRCVEHGSPTPLERWHCPTKLRRQGTERLGSGIMPGGTSGQ